MSAIYVMRALSLGIGVSTLSFVALAFIGATTGWLRKNRQKLMRVATICAAIVAALVAFLAIIFMIGVSAAAALGIDLGAPL